MSRTSFPSCSSDDGMEVDEPPYQGAGGFQRSGLPAREISCGGDFTVPPITGNTTTGRIFPTNTGGAVRPGSQMLNRSMPMASISSPQLPRGSRFDVATQQPPGGVPSTGNVGQQCQYLGDEWPAAGPVSAEGEPVGISNDSFMAFENLSLGPVGVAEPNLLEHFGSQFDSPGKPKPSISPGSKAPPTTLQAPQATAADSVRNRPCSSTTTPSRQSDVWRKLTLLQKSRICYHCSKRKWHHPLSSVCNVCQPLLQRRVCAHCSEEFVQHRVLVKVESHFGRAICLDCSKKVSEFGVPKNCCYCLQWSAFGANSKCSRCTYLLEKYGPPEHCCRCGTLAAFHREPDKMRKVDDLMLCFTCITNFKRDKYRQRKLVSSGASNSYKTSTVTNNDSLSLQNKRQGRLSVEASSSATGGRGTQEVESSNSSPAGVDAMALRQEICQLQDTIKSLKEQLVTLQEHMNRKDSEILTLAARFEKENFLLRKEADEHGRKSARDEVRFNNLARELSELDRSRELEIRRIIEQNQEEREKLNEIIGKLKTSNESLMADIKLEETRGKQMIATVEEKQRFVHVFKAATDRRVSKLAERFLKTMDRFRIRDQRRNQELNELRRQLASLEGNRERYLELERQVLGLSELEADAPADVVAVDAGCTAEAARSNCDGDGGLRVGRSGGFVLKEADFLPLSPSCAPDASISAALLAGARIDSSRNELGGAAPFLEHPPAGAPPVAAAARHAYASPASGPPPLAALHLSTSPPPSVSSPAGALRVATACATPSGAETSHGGVASAEAIGGTDSVGSEQPPPEDSSLMTIMMMLMLNGGTGAAASAEAGASSIAEGNSSKTDGCCRDEASGCSSAEGHSNTSTELLGSRETQPLEAGAVGFGGGLPVICRPEPDDPFTSCA